MAGRERIRTAVKGLDPNNDEHWTQGGLPSTNAVSDALGERVTRDEIENVVGDYRRPAVEDDDEQLDASGEGRAEGTPEPPLGNGDPDAPLGETPPEVENAVPTEPLGTPTAQEEAARRTLEGIDPPNAADFAAAGNMADAQTLADAAGMMADHNPSPSKPDEDVMNPLGERERAEAKGATPQDMQNKQNREVDALTSDRPSKKIREQQKQAAAHIAAGVGETRVRGELPATNRSLSLSEMGAMKGYGQRL